jgi:hypothetical protein
MADNPIEMRDGTLHFEIHAAAREEIAAMDAHVSMLLGHFGPDHRFYRDAEMSLRQQLARLLAFPFGGHTQVFRDDRLSLLVVSGGITGGLIFHGVHRSCIREGCRVYATDAGATYTYTGDAPRCEDGKHEWLYPLDWPTPGTWSFHT